MTRIITSALVAVGLLAIALVPAQAPQQGTVIVPAPQPSASPGTTVVAPSASGTAVIAPPGSTVTITPPAPAAIAVSPWCGGAYSPAGGSNFGSCPGFIPR